MKKKKGFTLVELLAVIVVLAVIIIIAVPVVISSMNAAKKNSFKIYAQKALNAAKTKTLTDSALGEVSTTSDKCYSLNDLGLETGNKYKGSVLYKADEEDYIIYLSDDDYIVQGLNFSEVSDNSKIKNSKNTTASSTCVEVEIGSSGDSADNSGGNTDDDNTGGETGGNTSGGTGDNTGDNSEDENLGVLLKEQLGLNDVTSTSSPGESTATTDEGLKKAQDDYSDSSYYYRGAVTNNYVEFANKCWRIVRVTGDGSIKLVLHNDNTNKYENPCNQKGDYMAFARINGTSYVSTFNNYSSYFGIIGFMYGAFTVSYGSVPYASAHANEIDSIILSNLKVWYDNNLREYDDLLADTIWCNDKSLGTGNGTTGQTQYMGLFRIQMTTLNGNSNLKPSLLCPIYPPDGDGNISKFTASDTTNGNAKLRSVVDEETLLYKIGLLTADEVAFAGGKFNTSNLSYYLYENTGSSWWTMTPAFSNGKEDGETFVVGSNGEITQTEVNDTGTAVRPAISLLSSIRVEEGGDGSATNPFVVLSNN